MRISDMSRRERAEILYGTTSFRCPKCHRHSYADGMVECPSCGWTEADDDEAETEGDE